MERRVVTRSMSRLEDSEALEFHSLATIEHFPDNGDFHVAWRLEDQYVAALPVRFAREPVVLLALPAEALDPGSVPRAPNGREAVGEVPARSGRARCRVSFLVRPVCKIWTPHTLNFI